jgi:hypothetical protein
MEKSKLTNTKKKKRGEWGEELKQEHARYFI